MEASLNETPKQVVVLPQELKEDIREYIRVDDGLKDTRLKVKDARKGLNDHKDRIINYMRHMEMKKISLKKGEQSLILQEKELKVRATGEMIKKRLNELILSDVKDPDAIYAEIQKCGGVKTVWKLSRRTKRKKC
jgi:hypothetical protein